MLLHNFVLAGRRLAALTGVDPVESITTLQTSDSKHYLYSTPPHVIDRDAHAQISSSHTFYDYLLRKLFTLLILTMFINV